MVPIYLLKQRKQIRMDSDNMKFSVDRIIDNIAVLENLDTKELLEINIEELPENIKDGTILKLENNQYTIDDTTQKTREETIREKMERLKRLKNNE